MYLFFSLVKSFFHDLLISGRKCKTLFMKSTSFLTTQNWKTFTRSFKITVRYNHNKPIISSISAKNNVKVSCARYCDMSSTQWNYYNNYACDTQFFNYSKPQRALTCKQHCSSPCGPSSMRMWTYASMRSPAWRRWYTRTRSDSLLIRKHYQLGCKYTYRNLYFKEA